MNAPADRTDLVEAKTLREESAGALEVGFGTAAGFALLQRQAKALADSTLVPAIYRSTITKKEKGGEAEVVNPAAISNCIIALNIAHRMRADVLMVMQHLIIIEGRPGWDAQFVIAMINKSGKFSPLRFRMSPWEAAREMEYTWFEWDDNTRRKVPRTGKVAAKNRTCVCVATELATGEELPSSEISIEMAVREGWYTRNGSKWQTMPEQMLRYRAAAFFGRIYCPELLMGIPMAEEIGDIVDSTATRVPDEPALPAGPRARSERERRTTTVEEAGEDVGATGPAASEAKQGSASQPASDGASTTSTAPTQKTGDVPLPPLEQRLTPVQLNILRAKFESGGLSTADLHKRFGISTLEHVSKENYEAVKAWLADPAACQ